MSTPPHLPIVPGPAEPPRLADVMPAAPRASNRGVILGTAVAVFSVLFLAAGAFVVATAGEKPTAAPPVRPSPSATCGGYAVDTTSGAVVCATPGSGGVVNAPAPNATTAAPPATTAPPPALPKDQVFTGRGDKVIRLKLSSDHANTATITHGGSSNFVVTSLDENGSDLDLVVNEIGKYTGVRPLDFIETPAALKIEADGSWKIVVRVLEKAPIWPGAATSGKGAMVVRVDPAAVGGLATATVTHRGSSNFVVYAFGNTAELLINEIGRYSGEVLLPSDTAALVIEADGAWTVRPV